MESLHTVPTFQLVGRVGQGLTCMKSMFRQRFCHTIHLEWHPGQFWGVWGPEKFSKGLLSWCPFTHSLCSVNSLVSCLICNLKTMSGVRCVRSRWMRSKFGSSWSFLLSLMIFKGALDLWNFRSKFAITAIATCPWRSPRVDDKCWA